MKSRNSGCRVEILYATGETRHPEEKTMRCCKANEFFLFSLYKNCTDINTRTDVMARKPIENYKKK